MGVRCVSNWPARHSSRGLHVVEGFTRACVLGLQQIGLAQVSLAENKVLKLGRGICFTQPLAHALAVPFQGHESNVRIADVLDAKSATRGSCLLKFICAKVNLALSCNNSISERLRCGCI